MAKIKVVSEPWHIHGRDTVCFEIEFIEGTVAVGMKMTLPPNFSLGKTVPIAGIEHLYKIPGPHGWGICVQNDARVGLETWTELDLIGKVLEVVE
ncbi:MAG TPA: hypothetical protein PK530_07085 [Anaerolineales bacterium]|nr:hypothetical protein [Anaerolineales bacterium]